MLLCTVRLTLWNFLFNNIYTPFALFNYSRYCDCFSLLLHACSTCLHLQPNSDWAPFCMTATCASLIDSFHFIAMINFYNSYHLLAACVDLFRRSVLDFYSWSKDDKSQGTHKLYQRNHMRYRPFVCAYVNPARDVLLCKIAVFVYPLTIQFLSFQSQHAIGILSLSCSYHM